MDKPAFEMIRNVSERMSLPEGDLDGLQFYLFPLRCHGISCYDLCITLKHSKNFSGLLYTNFLNPQYKSQG